ncbi:MAG TPA: hypothetical protein EYP58_02590 [bacterium (Candidatus Stahlbacteria)]|nr:hypothetical protein [Candidatus Stahlbacteria bacterium]
MPIDDLEDSDRGPFCKPFGQLFYDNLEAMPSIQVIEAYLTCLFQAQDRIQKAIAVLEGILKKGSEKLSTIKDPSDLQYLYSKSIGSKSEIEEEIEHLSETRRSIDELIARYTEKGVLGMPIKDFMTSFDADYKLKVEKKDSQTGKLYTTDIKGTDLVGCAGFDHLNKVLTGHLLKRLMAKKKS